MITKEQVKQILIPLRNQCLDEIRQAIIAGKNQNMVVSIIRNYNRKWNAECVKNPCLKKDGFNLYMKETLLSIKDQPEEFKNALKYL